MSDSIPPGASGGMPAFDDPALFSEAPGWPKAVGIISVVWGVVMLGCMGCCTFGGPAFESWGLQHNPQFKNLGPKPDVFTPQTSQYVLMGVGLLGDVILIIAGILTLQRNPAGRVLHLVYGILGVLLAIAGLILSLQNAAAATAWAQQNPNHEWLKVTGPRTILVFGLFFTALRVAWPAFCLVWFGAIKRSSRAMLEAPAPN